MAIYDVYGNPLIDAYSVSGESLAQAYDVEGNELIETGEPSYLTVMTYNYQWCTKINSQTAMQEAIIDKYNADIIGIQEAGGSYQTQTREWPSVAQNVLADYPYKYLSNHYNFNGLASKIELEDVTDTDYTEYDDEYWSYQKCYLYVDGKKIAWFNTHLTYKTDQATLLRKYAQAQELLTQVRGERYVIITGDFNMYGNGLNSADYIGVGKPFADAGYRMANWAGTDGFVKTWTDLTSATSLDQFTYACDNIIVSRNITFDSVTFDTTRLSYLNGQPIDHTPVIARLAIR